MSAELAIDHNGHSHAASAHDDHGHAGEAHH